ncbi:MAG: permease [Betaproteobacteria bacterium HGW-Betaproteobacteria-6]|nr:MAG: permease [Betaproteobacteria bacterium HGW-Betaproteobacteria-6]
MTFSRRLAVLIFGLFFGLTVAGCASGPLARKLHLDDPSPEGALLYNQSLARLPLAELGRERSVLAAVPQTPFTQVRMALLLGHPRVQQDLGKGLALLEGVLKSTEPEAVSFHPLARQLADNYQERLKLESQLEKQGLQLKDSQRKTTELQEKLDSLANIEKTLIPRPRAVGPNGGKR